MRDVGFRYFIIEINFKSMRSIRYVNLKNNNASHYIAYIKLVYPTEYF